MRPPLWPSNGPVSSDDGSCLAKEEPAASMAGGETETTTNKYARVSEDLEGHLRQTPYET